MSAEKTRPKDKPVCEKAEFIPINEYFEKNVNGVFASAIVFNILLWVMLYLKYRKPLITPKMGESDLCATWLAQIDV